MNFPAQMSVSLLAEDHDFIEICETKLRNSGFNRVTAYRTKSEFLKSRQQKPDIILIDYSNQAINGRETVLKIRHSHPNSHLVLILGNKNIVTAFNELHFSTFDHLIKNQIDEQRKQTILCKRIAERALLEKKYRISVMNRALTAIGIPIFLWLILETFFK
jgi:DNA-binding NtrC family response regulator